MKHRGPQVPHCLQLHWVLGSPLVWIWRSLRDAGKMPSPAGLWVGGVMMAVAQWHLSW